MKKICSVVVVTLMSFFALNAYASSKVDKKIGVGFNSQLSSYNVQSVSLRYWDSDNLGVEGILGFSFGDDNTYFDLGGKVLSVLIKENNLKVYGLGLLGLESASTKDSNDKTNNDTNITIGGGVGIEFFFTEIPNLGFGAEVGFAYKSDPKAFATFAGWLPEVGIRYYF